MLSSFLKGGPDEQPPKSQVRSQIPFRTHEGKDSKRLEP